MSIRLKFKYRSNFNDCGFFSRGALFPTIEDALKYVSIHRRFHKSFTDYAELETLENKEIRYVIYD